MRRRSGAGERRDAREVVDVVAVAAVGGDAPGGRVRLRDVALALEHRHLVAHRGRGDAEIGAARDRRRPDRLRARDVLLDDRPQDRGLAVVEVGLHRVRRVLGGAGVLVPGVRFLAVPGAHAAPTLAGPSELELALNATECQPPGAPPRADRAVRSLARSRPGARQHDTLRRRGRAGPPRPAPRPRPRCPAGPTRTAAGAQRERERLVAHASARRAPRSPPPATRRARSRSM